MNWWIVFSIINIIIIVLIRIWLIRKVFSKINKKTFFTTCITSILSVFLITIFYYIKISLNLSEKTYIYIYSIVIIIIGIVYFKKNRFAWQIIQSILWIGLGLGWWINGWYAMSALWEESFKWTYIKKHITGLFWEIILLWIISAIIFWRTENIVYDFQYIINKWSNNDIITIIQQRWIFPIIVHIGSICLSLIIWFTLNKKVWEVLSRSIWLIIGIGSHFLFNISQINQFALWSSLIIICYCLIISYSLFKNDLLYTAQKIDK